MKTGRPPSKARKLKHHLLRLMADQEIPVGGRLPSEAELMQQFQISRSTVRQAFIELTSEGLVERRQGKGTFRKDGRSTLRPIEQLMLVGVWFNWPTGPLFGPIAEGIRDELRRLGYYAIFEKGGVAEGDEPRGIAELARKGLQGFIVSPSSHVHEEHKPLADLIDRGVPVVLVDYLLPGHEADLVTTNSEMGAEELTEHLIEMGHRRIAFVGIEGLPTMRERHRGYEHTMQRHSLAVDPAWVHITEEVGIDCGRHAAEELLSLPAASRPTAIFGGCDMIAGMVVTVAREWGVGIPTELSIVGFDDVVVEPEKHSWLTTYAQPKYRIGQQAARLLVKRISHPTRQRVTVYLPGTLIKRESSGPAPRG